MAQKYVMVTVNGKQKRLHRLIAERALGKPLPVGAVVHHVDGDRANNANANLVICPDEAYHQLLHNRQRAMEATGDPNALRCGDCGWWIKPDTDHDAVCRAKVGRTGGKPRGFAKYPLYFGRGVFDGRTRRTIPRPKPDEKVGETACGHRFTNRSGMPE